MPPLMPDEDKNFGGSLALNSGGMAAPTPLGASPFSGATSEMWAKRI